MDISYDISLLFANDTTMTGNDLGLQETAPGIFEGSAPGVFAKLHTGNCLYLTVENSTDIPINAIGWHMICREAYIAKCRVPLACTIRDTGVIALENESPESSLFTGLFYGSDAPCLFLGTQLPQNNIHKYQVFAMEENEVKISGTTSFTVGQSVSETLSTETTLVYQEKSPLAAFRKYAEHLPELPANKLPEPMVGWNSWDYYFTTVSSAAVKENLEFIHHDVALRSRLTAVVVDDGWETCVGEWYANHRFPEGLKHLADMIKSYGLIPGIWTNGAQTESLCEAALRHPEYYILDEFGIPFTVDGKQVLDPTHPAAEGFILDTYSRLYEAGFRIFKVDFISTILEGKRFYDKACGPYEAVRRLLRLIRQAVGQDSHIVGCSFPAECGAGIVDSSRISVDIHNHWPHVLWIMEYMQARFWMNGKLFRIDPDMLVVRGCETSLEEETNVFNPWNLVPPGRDRFTSRWRRGPVFNYQEAETWANLVVFSGGDILLGDRLSMLNPQGLKLLHAHLEPHQHSAVPLDLGDREVSEVWYDCHTDSLLLVNTEDTYREMEFSFARFQLSAPEGICCDKPCTYQNGVCKVPLQPHESAILSWKTGQ